MKIKNISKNLEKKKKKKKPFQFFKNLNFELLKNFKNEVLQF